MDVKYVCNKGDYSPLPSADVVRIETLDQFKRLFVFFGESSPEEERISEAKMAEKFLMVQNGPWEDFVIEKDDQIVARAVIWHFQSDSSEIGCVRTLQSYQNQGFCSQLISRCTEVILQKGSIPIGITTDDNLLMRRVYEKIGFLICEV